MLVNPANHIPNAFTTWNPACHGVLLATGHGQSATGRHFTQSTHDAGYARCTFSAHIGKGITLESRLRREILVKRGWKNGKWT